MCSTACRIQPQYRVQASHRQAFISLGDDNGPLEHLGVNYNLYAQVRPARAQPASAVEARLPVRVRFVVQQL